MKNVHNVLKYILKINENYKNRKIGLRKKFLFFPKFLTEQRRILQNMQSTFLHSLIGFNDKYQGEMGVQLYDSFENLIIENVDKVHHIPKV